MGTTLDYSPASWHVVANGANIDAEHRITRERFSGTVDAFNAMVRARGYPGIDAIDSIIENPRKVPVTALLSSGLVRNSLGELVWRPGLNQLVKTWPTPWAVPHDRDGVARYSATTLSGGAIDGDIDVADPLTGLPMSKVTLPAGSGSEQRIYYDALPRIDDISPNHTWLLPIRIPHGYDGLVRIRVMISSEDAVIRGTNPTNARIIHLDSEQLQGGMHVQQFLQSEIQVTGTQHTVLGTSHRMQWADAAGQTSETKPRSVSIRVLGISPGLSEPIDVWVGALHIAPPGWATSAIMWAADDVPSTFHDLILPIFEERKIPVTLNIASGYSSIRQGEYMTQAQCDAAVKRGRHELWGHTRRHDRMTDGTNADKERAVREAGEFWRNRGVQTASQLMAYPFGAYDDSTIALLKLMGYSGARATHGVAMCSAAPLCERYALPALTVENITPNQVRAALNGMIKRGSALTTYMHNALPGGSDVVTATAGTVYADHIRRYLDEQILPARDAGTCEPLTMTEYFKACGTDILDL